MMTTDEQIDMILEGRTEVAMQAHVLMAWKYEREHGHPPSTDELRAYLQAGHGRFKSFWEQGKEQLWGA